MAESGKFSLHTCDALTLSCILLTSVRAGEKYQIKQTTKSTEKRTRNRKDQLWPYLHAVIWWSSSSLERFVLLYCFRFFLTGILSSLFRLIGIISLVSTGASSNWTQVFHGCLREFQEYKGLSSLQQACIGLVKNLHSSFLISIFSILPSQNHPQILTS